MKQWLLSVLVVLVPGVTSAEEPKVYNTFLIEQHFRDFQEMLDSRNPLEIEDIAALPLNRMLAEALVMQIAPVLGGCECRIEYSPYEVDTVHARSIEQVKGGQQLTHGVAGFQYDSRMNDPDIMLSDPILSADEFYVGLYTYEGRDEILSLDDPDSIAKLRFGVGRNWEIDRKILSQKGLTEVPADTWNNLIRMISIGRADVILQPFTSEPDFAFVDTVSGYRFVPIPGYKLLFGDGRYYMVSRRHPDGEAFLQSLNRGLAMLRDQGVLKQVMISAGVVNPRVDDFEELLFEEKH